MPLTRTIQVRPTPEELAAEFCDMVSDDQAAFFRHVWQIASSWPGGGLCGQAFHICKDLDADGVNAVSTLASHLPVEVLARIMKGALD